MPLAVVGGEYRLVELVGTNALGSVYHAQHLSSGRVVAVRLLRPVARDPVAMASFQAELPAIAGLSHPNLLPVERWGDLDGVPYVVTPLPDAEPLADRLGRGWRPDRATALRLLRGIAAGVDSAHALGVAHGDLGPANVLVVVDGTALVAHLGLARLAGASPLTDGTAIQHGSPAHVAPERVLGDAVGPAADVHAFAVIAHQLLTGTAPLGGESALEQLSSHVHQAPAPPSPSRSPGASPGPSARPPAPVVAPGSPQPTAAPTPTVAPTPAPTPIPTLAPNSLSMAVSDPAPVAGEFVQVNGQGFDPSQQYVIDFAQNGNTWRVQGTASPRGDGSFTNPVRIPVGAQPGAGTLVGCVYLVHQIPPGPTTRCAPASVSVR